MPSKKSVPKPEPIIPFTDFERSRLIVQLRCELLMDLANAFAMASTSGLQPLELTQRTTLRAVADGLEAKSDMAKATLRVANDVRRMKE